MCGFSVYVGPSARAYARAVRESAERLCHRGPDGAGFVESDRAVLAHRRLAIIDLSGGSQPLQSEDGSTVLVCNGEIYNHRSLRRGLEGRHRFQTQSDSEVILHLYEERGPACVEDLDGMFAFVVACGQRFLAARDPLGIKPLYFARRDDGGMWFASELKAFPRDVGDPKELPPGCSIAEAGKVERWYCAPWTKPRVDPVDPDCRALSERLEDAVKKRLMSDVPVGVFLSGGLDSSIIAALMRRHVDELHSFSVGLEGAPDLLAARQVARHLRTRHHERIYSVREISGAVVRVIEHLESYDPALIRSAVPCYLLAELTSEHVKVVLTGEGADEIFAGYGHFSNVDSPRLLHEECVRLLAGLHNMNLQRVDRMTMAHAIEGRVPFLDLGFLAWAMAIDPRHKLQHSERQEKWLLRRAFEALLPEEIVWRKKQEFADGCGADAPLRHHGEQAVTGADFERRAMTFPVDTPQTKEEFFYRRIFDEMFPGDALRETVGRWRRAQFAVH